MIYNEVEGITLTSITTQVNNTKYKVDVLLIYVASLEQFDELLKTEIQADRYKYIAIYYCNKIYITPSSLYCSCILKRLRDNYHVFYETRIPFYDGHHINKTTVMQMLEQFDFEKLNLNKISEIFIFNNNQINEHELICFHKCSNLNNNIQNKIQANNFLVSENGRSISTSDFLKLTDNYIGLFKPIVNLYEENDIRYDGLNYYLSNIGGETFNVLNISNAGKGTTREASIASAIGESFERYCSQYKIHVSGAINEKYRNLKNVITKEYIYTNTENFNENAEHYWVTCKSLITDEQVYVPAECVYFEFLKTKNFLNTTTGLSTGSNKEEAIYQASLEIIERDAYIRTFRTKKSSPKLIMDKFIKSQNEELIRDIELQGFVIHAQKLKSDLDYIHIVHVTLEDELKYPKYTHGIGASYSLETAFMRAVTEAFQLRITQKIVKDLSDIQIKKRQLEPYITWGNGNVEQIEPFLDQYCSSTVYSSKISDVSIVDLKKFNKKLFVDLENLGFKSYYYDLTTDDVPVSVVRVIIEGYQNYDLGGKFQTSRLKSEMQGRSDEREVFY